MAPDLDLNDRRRIYQLAVGFFLLAAGYYGAQNCITSVLGPNGAYSLGMFFGTQAIMAFLAPTIIRVIRGKGVDDAILRGEKRGLVLGTFGYVPYLIALAIPNALVLQLATGATQGMASGVLWVAQGSILTACSRSSNREQMAGNFWGVFQGGQMLGNLGTSAWQHYIQGDNRDMFLACSAIVAVSGLSHLFLFHCRDPLELLTLHDSSTKSRASVNTPLTKHRRSDQATVLHKNSAVKGSIANSSTPLIDVVRHPLEEHKWPSMLIGSIATNSEIAASLSQTRYAADRMTVAEGALAVLQLFRVPHTLMVAPLCWLIGSEVAWYSGTFPTLLRPQDIGNTLAFLGVGELIGSFSVGATVGCLGTTITIVWVCIVFVFGINLAVWSLRDGNWTYTLWDLSVPGILCAMCYGYADAFLNSLALARLGGLATDWRICSGIVAYSFYLVVDVGSSGAAFLYLPFFPIRESDFQIYLLCILVVVSCATFIASTPESTLGSLRSSASKLGLRRSISHALTDDDFT